MATAASAAAAAAAAAAATVAAGGGPITTTTTGSETTTLSHAGGLYDQAHYYSVGVWEKYGDPRVGNYHLMRTPWPTIAATLLYYWFVRSVGPKMMRDRKAYEILPLIRVYNLMMAAWNGWGFYTACQLVNYGVDLIGCRPVDIYQRDEKTLSMIYYGWMFFTSRLIEFADTIFFVLRKKDSQVSSFHVFHHSSVPTATWFFLKFAPGGNSGIFPFINTLVHTIMYTYYFLATFTSMRPYLGWKKYLTQMQIVQFFIIIAGCMQPLFIPGCKFPRILLQVMIGFSFIFLYLFGDFYVKSYRRKSASGANQQHQIRSKSSELTAKSTTTTTTTIREDDENNNICSNRNHNNNNSNGDVRLRSEKVRDKLI